jgi:hypothetical protein
LEEKRPTAVAEIVWKAAQINEWNYAWLITHTNIHDTQKRCIQKEIWKRTSPIWGLFLLGFFFVWTRNDRFFAVDCDCVSLLEQNECENSFILCTIQYI